MSEERDITGLVKAESAKDTLAPFFAVHADFPSGAIRIWTGAGEIEFGGHTYQGVGEFLSIELAAESIDTAAQGVSATLSGIPTGILDPVTLDEYQGQTAELYFGYLDTDQDNLQTIADPVLLFTGQMDTDEVRDDGRNAQVTIHAEHRLSDHLRRREWRYTQESQHALQGSTADKGLEFIPTLVEAQIQWGEI